MSRQHTVARQCGLVGDSQGGLVLWVSQRLVLELTLPTLCSHTVSPPTLYCPMLPLMAVLSPISALHSQMTAPGSPLLSNLMAAHHVLVT